MCKSAQQHGFWNCCAHLGLYSPRIETPPANKYWAIEASFQYGNASLSNPNTTAGIVDTGTSLIGLASGKPLRDSNSYQICEPLYHLC